MAIMSHLSNLVLLKSWSEPLHNASAKANQFAVVVVWWVQPHERGATSVVSNK